MNRPGLLGDFWPWKVKDGVHAVRAQRWEAEHASVFGVGEKQAVVRMVRSLQAGMGRSFGAVKAGRWAVWLWG